MKTPTSPREQELDQWARRNGFKSIAEARRMVAKLLRDLDKTKALLEDIETRLPKVAS